MTLVESYILENVKLSQLRNDMELLPSEYDPFLKLEMEDETMWTLEEGIKFARKIEDRIKPRSLVNMELRTCDAHCCLGGSVLMRGSSWKDLDIFIYPHQRELNVSEVITWIKDILPDSSWEKLDFTYDCKEVHQTHLKDGKRVDFFFFLSTPIHKPEYILNFDI